MSILADGRSVPSRLVGLSVGDAANPSMTRHSVISVEASLPPGTKSVSVGWQARFGALVLRQAGVAEPYQGYLTPGQMSPPIPLAGSGSSGGFLGTFMTYVKVGFIHILPRGPDHILFVLGLFFLAPRLSPLLWQVSAFTAAHTLALALAASGRVSVPPGIVEPAIAASIVFVAFENLRSAGISRWRPLTVFAFGLLHGLGFAGVLAEFGLPRDGFVAALAGFNIGVEIAQIAIVLAAFVLIGKVFGHRRAYRAAVAVPASIAIGAVGAIWTFDRIWGLSVL